MTPRTTTRGSLIYIWSGRYTPLHAVTCRYAAASSTSGADAAWVDAITCRYMPLHAAWVEMKRREGSSKPR